MSVLELKNINKTFDGNHVLKDISLILHPGEILGIWGSNASAKTTLAKIISGNMQADSGFIYVDRQQRNIKNPNMAKALGIAIIHEDIELFENLTVAENIYMGSYKKITKSKLLNALGIVNKKDVFQKAQNLFEQYNFKIDAASKVRQLGMAEKQIVFILHELIKQARILILDEPFSNLDLNDINKIFHIIKGIQKAGVSIIYLSQNLKQLSEISTTLLVLEDGRLENKFKNYDKSDISNLYDKEMQYPFPKLSTPKYDVFYEAKNICYKDIIKDVSFQIYHGEILGILGTSNSGRSTLARLICGDLKMTIGKTYINGKEIKITSPVTAHRNRISYISEDTLKYGLLPYSNLEKNITLNNYHHKNRGLFRFIISNKKLIKESKLVADKFGINYKNNYQLPVRYLSAGHQKKIAFARSVYAGSQLYILDEPTKGIDTTGRLAIYNIMNELSKEGKCILFFTSDIEEAAGMCDRILILRHGQIVGEFIRNEYSPEKLYNKIYI